MSTIGRAGCNTDLDDTTSHYNAHSSIRECCIQTSVACTSVCACKSLAADALACNGQCISQSVLGVNLTDDLFVPAAP